MKRLTEKALLDNYTGLSNGGHCISEIDGKNVYWNFRSDGCVCCQKLSDCILTEDYYTGISEKEISVSPKWYNHKNAIRIKKDEAELFPA